MNVSPIATLFVFKLAKPLSIALARAIMVYMDVDLATSIRHLKMLIYSVCDDYDFAKGSRMLRARHTGNRRAGKTHHDQEDKRSHCPHTNASLFNRGKRLHDRNSNKNNLSTSA